LGACPTFRFEAFAAFGQFRFVQFARHAWPGVLATSSNFGNRAALVLRACGLDVREIVRSEGLVACPGF